MRQRLSFLLSIFCLAGLPVTVEATLEDSFDDTREADRNIARLVSVLRRLDRTGALTGELADTVELLDQAQSTRQTRASLNALLPDVVRSGALRERTSPRAYALSRPRANLQSGSDRSRVASPLSWGVLTARGVTPLPNTRDVWLEVSADDARQDDVDGFDGFESSSLGVNLGVGFELSDRWHLGFSAGIHAADVETDFFGDDDINLDDIGVTLTFTQDRHSLQLGYARTFTTTERERIVIINTDSGRRAFGLESTIDADQDMLAIGYSAVFTPTERFAWSPFIDLATSRWETDDYFERGGEVALLVETDDATHLVGGIGVNLSWYEQRGSWTLSPQLTLAFEHDFEAEATETLSRFRNTALTFTTEGYGIEENRWRYGAGLSFFYRDDLGLSLTYEGQRKGEYRYDGASLSLLVRF